MCMGWESASHTGCAIEPAFHTGCGSQHHTWAVCENQPSDPLELTEFSMLRSIPSSKNADSVHTLWMEETTVPLEAGTPKINVQMESKSNCR